MRSSVSRIAAWIDNRTGLQAGLSRFLFEEIPASAGWPQVFGSIALFLFLVQSLTGILLALNYAPTAGEAYTSLVYIMQQVAGGRMMHGLHHWGASLMIIVVFLHMAQVFIFGAFKRPREATWLAGVLLLLFTLGFALTGYLLPWDNRSYWGTVVTTKIVAGLPVAGPVLTRLAGAADGVGAITFARFYALHTLLFPACTVGLIIFHVYLVRRHGITPAEDRLEKMQTFYPKQLFRDFIAVFITFACLFLAACFLDVPLEAMANPNDTAYVPRPEWYFLFLFQLLKIFPGKLELIGTLILPLLTILCLALLPFFDRVNTRMLGKRVQLISVAVLAFSTWSALTAAAVFSDKHPKANARVSPSSVLWAQIPPEVIAGYGYFRALRCESCHDLIVGTPKPGPILGLTGIQHPRDWMLQHFDENRPGQDGSPSTSLTMPQRNALVVFVANLKPDLLVTLLATSPQFINGAQIFVASACASCHKVNGIGGDSGPSLNGVFSRRSETWIREHFAAPRKLSPGSIMPPYKFNPKDEDDLIKYLLSLPE